MTGNAGAGEVDGSREVVQGRMFGEGVGVGWIPLELRRGSGRAADKLKHGAALFCESATESQSEHAGGSREKDLVEVT